MDIFELWVQLPDVSFGSVGPLRAVNGGSSSLILALVLALSDVMICQYRVGRETLRGNLYDVACYALTASSTSCVVSLCLDTTFHV